MFNNNYSEICVEKSLTYNERILIPSIYFFVQLSYETYRLMPFTEQYTVNPWKMQGLEAPNPCTVKNLCITFDLPQT